MNANSNVNCSFTFPSYALEVLSVLEESGFEAWMVGGCVRDSLRNVAPKDFDIASQASAHTARMLFANRGYKISDLGLSHGTFGVVFGDKAVEITQYRGSMQPLNCECLGTNAPGAGIAEDLAHRDFTMNALAWHPTRGLFDPHCGSADIQRGLIRCVGDPLQRFREDALRILRAIRFCSTLHFSIEPETKRAMLCNMNGLNDVSGERIRAELEATLLGDNVLDALLKHGDVLKFALPEIAGCLGFAQVNAYHIYNVYEHIAHTVRYTPATPLLRWAALLHDIGKPAAYLDKGDGITHFYGHAALSAQLARSVARRLRFSRAFTADLLTLIEHHDDKVRAERKSIRKLLYALDGRTDLVHALFDLMRADAFARKPEWAAVRLAHVEECALLAEELLAEKAALTVRDLAISGHDVMAQLGISAGPAVGNALRRALEAVVDERVENRADALLGYLSQEYGAKRLTSSAGTTSCSAVPAES